MSKDKSKKDTQSLVQDSIVTAILVDGGFYRKRIQGIGNYQDPVKSAEDLYFYCMKHLIETINGIQHNHHLYRVFYYDCPPIQKTIYNPVAKKNIDLGKTTEFSWTTTFFDELRKKRKFALRLGKISETNIHFTLREKSLLELLKGKKTVQDLNDTDVYLELKQKGVDMRIGLDIASLSYKKQVNQIILISGDSDFVSAAKLARREGIDFILDPLGAQIKPDLFEHVDGLRTCDSKFRY